MGCMHALLLAGVNTQLIDVHGGTAPQWAEVKGQPTAALPADSEIYQSVQRGELQKVTKWLRKGGPVDALYPVPDVYGEPSALSLLHVAAANGRLEMVRELLKRGASVELPSSLGLTALMQAAYRGHLSILLLLLQHSANPDLQSNHGGTALMLAAGEGQEACVKALLRAKANTELLDDHGETALQWAEDQGHTATAKLIRQHAARPQQTAATPAAPPDAGKHLESPSASLPLEIYESAQEGELRKVVKWLRKGGPVDALCPLPTEGGRSSALSLLHAAAANGHLEMARELLKRGASVNLPTSGGITALMGAAGDGHLSVMLLLLQHSANPDLQSIGGTTLMWAAARGQEACVQALLLAKADTELIDNNGNTALQYAEYQGHTATAKLIRQHASCLSLGLGVALCARVPLAWPWVVLSVVLGTITMLAFSRTLMAGPGHNRAAQQRRSHRPSRHARAQGRTNTAEPTR